MNRTSITVFLLLLCSVGGNAYAQQGQRETQVILHSTVTGNREQPRVMYIVPWDQPGDSRFEHKLQRSIARELFDPIDRDEFVRAMTYKTKLNSVKKGEDHGKL